MKRLIFCVVSLLLSAVDVSGSDVGCFFWEGKSIHANGDQISPSMKSVYSQRYQFDLHYNTSKLLNSPLVEFSSSQDFAEFEPHPGYFPQADFYVWSYPSKTITGTGVFNIHATQDVVIQSPGITFIRSVDSPVLSSSVSEQTVTLDLMFHQPLAPNINNLCVEVRRDIDPRCFSHVVMLSESSPAGWSYDLNRKHWHADNPQVISVGTHYRFEITLRYTKQAAYNSTQMYYKPFVQTWWGDGTNLPDYTGSSIFMNHPKGETVYCQFDGAVDWQRGYGQDEQHFHIRDVLCPVDDSGPIIDNIMFYCTDNYFGNNNIGYEIGFGVEGTNIVQAFITTPAGMVWPMDIEDEEVSLSFDGLLTSEQLESLGMIDGEYELTAYDHLGQSVTTSFDVTRTDISQTPTILYPVNETNNRVQNLDAQWQAVSDSRVDQIIFALSDDFDDVNQYLFGLPVGMTSYHLSDMPADMGINCSVYFAHTVNGSTSTGVPIMILTGSGGSVHFCTGKSAWFGDIDGDGDVDSKDFSLFSSVWMENNCVPQPLGDMDDDCDVDLEDLALLSQNWLKGK